VTNLNPTNYQSSVLDVYGTQQVGWKFTEPSNYNAMLWTGTAASAVTLGPLNSMAFATDGTQQAGWENGGAALWSSTAATYVNLQPASGYSQTWALAVSPTHQAGYGQPLSGGFNQALLWSGTAASVVNLSPTQFTGLQNADCNSTYGNQGVGFYETGGNYHAVLWTGTAASAVSLEPATFNGQTVESSQANATNGNRQIGLISTDITDYAVVWSGTAASAMDLGALLPTTGLPGDGWTSVTADSIDSSGNVYGTANGTYDGMTGVFAIEWTAVPEPATASLLIIAAAGALMRRRNRPHVLRPRRDGRWSRPPSRTCSACWARKHAATAPTS
jgi:hypothetical protein